MDSLAVSGETTISASLSVDANAALGPRSITVTTLEEEATLPNGFWVLAAE